MLSFVYIDAWLWMNDFCLQMTWRCW